MSLLLLTLTAAIVTADPAAAAAQRRADDAFIRGDYDTAIFHFNESIRLDPFELRPYAGRGAAYYRKKNYEKAIESYGEGLQIDPRSDALHFDRGTSYWSLGRAQAAADDFREAIRLNPKNDFAYNGLAWILATAPDDEMRDGRQSLKLATCRRSPPPTRKQETSKKPSAVIVSPWRYLTIRRTNSTGPGNDCSSTSNGNPTAKRSKNRNRSSDEKFAAFRSAIGRAYVSSSDSPASSASSGRSAAGSCR
jgi:tetratricopeptide (TPR) repeat protein